jgi:hypothetical protein
MFKKNQLIIGENHHISGANMCMIFNITFHIHIRLLIFD